MISQFANKWKFLCCVIVVVVTATKPAQAANITYDVIRQVGTASVTGIIVTDGTIGKLTSENILEWNLVLKNTATTGSMNLTGPDTGHDELLLVGNNVKATKAAIRFNNNGTGTLQILRETKGCIRCIWKLSAKGQTGRAGESINVQHLQKFYNYTISVPRTGVTIVGKARP